MRFRGVRVVEVAEFDYDYEQTTDGRYDLRPYGPYLPARYPGRYRLNAAMTTRLQMTSLVTIAFALLMLNESAV